MDILLSLQKIKSNRTTLITLLIPTLHKMWLAHQTLSREIGIAANIKDKNVSKSIIEGLKIIKKKIKTIKKFPINGIAIFACGSNSYI